MCIRDSHHGGNRNRQPAAQGGQARKTIAHPRQLQPGAELHGTGTEMRWKQRLIGHLDLPALTDKTDGQKVAARL